MASIMVQLEYRKEKEKQSLRAYSLDALKKNIIERGKNFMELIRTFTLLDETDYEALYDAINDESYISSTYRYSLYNERDLKKAIGFEIEGYCNNFVEWKAELEDLHRVYYRYTNNDEYDRYLHLLKVIRDLTEEEFLSKRKNGMKLGKWLKREGFEQSVLDYNGSVERDAVKKRYLFIINPFEYAILGMSALAKFNSWDGYMGTSCQDWRHDTYLHKHLDGSLCTKELVIGQLIELEANEDPEKFTTYASMEDRLIARTNLFIFQEDGAVFVKRNTLYGNSKTKAALKDVLEVVKNEINLI